MINIESITNRQRADEIAKRILADLKAEFPSEVEVERLLVKLAKRRHTAETSVNDATYYATTMERLDDCTAICRSIQKLWSRTTGSEERLVVDITLRAGGFAITIDAPVEGGAFRPVAIMHIPTKGE